MEYSLLQNETTHTDLHQSNVIDLQQSKAISTEESNLDEAVLCSSNEVLNSGVCSSSDFSYPDSGSLNEAQLQIENMRITRQKAKEIQQQTINLNFLHSNKNLPNPQNVKEALERTDSKNWQEAMTKEIENLKKKNTWELVDKPKNSHVIESKWVFNIKRNKNGEIIKYKARLVAKGYRQKYGIDFKETFSPVARYSTIRLILSLAAEYDLLVHQIDVVSAYLNGDLNEEVFMKQPEGFVDKNFPEKICKLKKALYGLKQSGREWNAKLDETIKSFGFKQCYADACTYVRNSEDDIIIIVVYVDDIIIVSKSIKTIDNIKQNLAAAFEIVDHGEV